MTLPSLSIYFNSQPHEEADVALKSEAVKMPPYFNSQPHEEADYSPTAANVWWNISTHSLTKRLTYLPGRW